MTRFIYSENSSDLDRIFRDEAERWSSIFILVDSNTHKLCLPIFLNSVSFSTKVEILEVDAGEDSKNIEIAAELWLALADLKADRKSLIINLGGGVVSDLGAWVAANYKRGIDFINVPTTLLAMIDAAIGGKTGIDLGGIKNLVGSFSLPCYVLTYPPFLKTLAKEEWYSGFAEMIKHSLISSVDLWKSIKEITPSDHQKIENLVQRVAQIKIDIVKEDFKEDGVRKTLNFGHTIGHAIEAVSMETDNSISHGHSIAIGMLLATIISTKKTGLRVQEMKEINDYIRSHYAIPSCIKNESKNIIAKIKHDKKNIGDTILMVLLSGIGDAVIDIAVDEKCIVEAMDELLKG